MTGIYEQLNLLGLDQALDLARTASERKRLRMAHDYLSNEDLETNYLYSGFCQTALPHREPKNPYDLWQRKSGNASLTIRPGILPKEDGTTENVGIPYGSRARLVLIHWQTEAIKHQSPEIRLGGSTREWFAKLGLSGTGGERGNYGAVKEQTMRIARCTFTIRGAGSITDIQLINHMTLWGSDRNTPKDVWLTHEFFELLKDHAVPLDELALAKLKQSSLALDLYCFLASRLWRVDKPEGIFLTWRRLAENLGSASNSRVLGQRIQETMKDVMAVYPDARVDVDPRGLRLFKSATPVARATKLGWTGGLKAQPQLPAPAPIQPLRIIQS